MPNLTEQERQALAQKLIEAQSRELQGGVLKLRDEARLEKENEALRKAAAEYQKEHGTLEGFWPAPKREKMGLTFGTAKKFTPRQEKAAKSIKEGLGWEKLRKLVMGD